MPDVRLAIDPDAPPAVLRLKEGSLPDLIAGEYVLRVWLREVETEPGVYTLFARTAEGDPRVTGLVRAILWDTAMEDEPPIPDASEEVADVEGRWKAAFVAMAEAEENDGDLLAEALTPWERLQKAESVVREQRDPDGEYGAIGNPDFAMVPNSVYEAMLEEQFARLQRAVMGEPEPA